ncbi:MAG TPA: hypothetical protein VIS48_10385 [Candidatus Kryptonia bacterium]
MPTIDLFWLILFCISTVVLFSIAGIITVFGIKDMKSLLSRSDKKEKGKANSGNGNPLR